MAAQKVLDVLERNNINFKLLRHNDYGEIRSPQDFARLSNTPIENIAKSLLVKGGEGYAVAVLPVAVKADLDAISRLCGLEQLKVAPLDELPQMTGFERFATTAIGLELPVIIDEALLDKDVVYVASGEMGEEIGIHPSDLIEITKAVTGKISL